MEQKTILKSFHNDQAVKDKYVRRVRDHEKADAIIQGVYWEGGKGCAVGCTIEGDDHTKYERELGLPVWLAHLEDGIFEGLSNGDAKQFPLKFLQAIPVGVQESEFERVKWEFLSYLARMNLENENFWREHDTEDVYASKVVGVLKDVLTLYKRAALGETVDWSAESAESAERSARSAARSARSAAGSAAWSAAGSAAWSAESAESAGLAGLAARSAGLAARSAASSSAELAARSAASSAAESAAGSAAWSAAYKRMRTQLLKLLRGMKA